MYRDITCVYCHNPIDPDDYRRGFQELFEDVFIDFHTLCFAVVEELIV